MPLPTEYSAADRASRYRAQDEEFAHWARGYGVITHEDLTQVRIADALARHAGQHGFPSRQAALRMLSAADRLASAGLWLAAHVHYTRQVYLDGRPLAAEDFKDEPAGDATMALKAVPAYVGYLAANALGGITRSWLLSQGRGGAAVDAVNLLVGNLSAAHAARYGLSDAQLSRFAQDFGSKRMAANGRPQSPLGGCVNVHTAGGVMSGGYPGLAELQYVHMPLPGERLVALLSDGGFEEQRGSDWAPRWWRAEDSGLVAPIMLTADAPDGNGGPGSALDGLDWLRDHLRLNGFTPIDLDGRDPAAFVWTILEIERLLSAAAQAVTRGTGRYPVALPCGIAATGDPGAHTLALDGHPASDPTARAMFNRGTRELWVPAPELRDAAGLLQNHDQPKRARERDHPLAQRRVRQPQLPEPAWHETDAAPVSPTNAVDAYFCRIRQANPGLRPRVGNPAVMRRNGLPQTLEMLKQRSLEPDPNRAEAVDGSVITALNEEAVACAALGNKGGINMIVSYEAFAVKMLGALRQELIFAREQHLAAMEPGWLSVPVLCSADTWEDGSSDPARQDPTFSESMLGEMTDLSRVLFPADANTAAAALQAAYRSRGQIWTLVVPRRPLPVRFSRQQTHALLRDGAVRVRGRGDREETVQFVAIGAYQLGEALKASDRLTRFEVPHSVIYIQEPGRFRVARDEREAVHLASGDVIDRLFPGWTDVRVFLTHTRPEALIGVVWPLLDDPLLTPVLGFVNHAGALDEGGMLFANRCNWAHAIAAVAAGYGDLPDELLSAEEFEALSGDGDPTVLLQ